MMMIDNDDDEIHLGAGLVVLAGVAQHEVHVGNEGLEAVVAVPQQRLVQHADADGPRDGLVVVWERSAVGERHKGISKLSSRLGADL
jgi:hypothetical protein